MNVFSKPEKSKDQTQPPITYADFFKQKINLQKYKIPQLKVIARHNGLHVSGTKRVLVDRIQTHFQNSKHAIKIQAQYRGYLVRRLFRLHGPAFRHVARCVNDSDFYTLDPLDEIDLYHFFSYEDERGFLYGFHIQSLINMFQKSGAAKNPYTRELFSDEVLQNILAFYRISHMILIAQPRPRNISSASSPHMDGARVEGEAAIENRVVMVTGDPIQQPNFTNARNQTLERLEELRSKDLATRIHEVFIEIDLLGNYTQSTWFSGLHMYAYMKFIQSLYSIWTHRANMSLHVRSQICPFYNPFNYQIDATNMFAAHNMNLNNLRNCALIIMENIVFSGGDIDFRRIGVMHILTALTLVSTPARESLPWLYESVIMA